MLKGWWREKVRGRPRGATGSLLLAGFVLAGIGLAFPSLAAAREAEAFLPPLSAPAAVLFPEEAAGAPPVGAAAAVLIDYYSGAVLYEHNMHRALHPASTTKIVTAILALEHGRPDDLVVVSRKAAYTEGSSMGLREGDVFTVDALLHGLMLASGNDAAVALAEHVSGSEGAFAQLMTERVRRLGLANSTFRNAHGLTHPEHLTTAYDLAMVARYALAMPRFRHIVGLRRAEVPLTDGRSRILFNTNRLLSSYSFAEGVKTGTTSAAGQTLVAAASYRGQRLIAVVLRSPNRWREAEALFRWGFETFATSPLAAAGGVVGRLPLEGGLRPDILVAAAQPLYVTAPRQRWSQVEGQLFLPPAVTAPVARGRPVGTLAATFNGKTLAAVPVITAAEAVKFSLVGALARGILPLLQIVAPPA